MNIKDKIISGFSTILNNPATHGWLLIAASMLIFLHLLNFIKFIDYLVHYIFFGGAVYMFIYGAIEVDLLGILRSTYYWIMSRFGK